MPEPAMSTRPSIPENEIVANESTAIVVTSEEDTTTPEPMK